MSEIPQTPQDEVYTPEYFVDLDPGFYANPDGTPNEIAIQWAKQWNKKGGQSMEEVRKGVLHEREMRLQSAERWVSDLPKHEPSKDKKDSD